MIWEVGESRKNHINQLNMKEGKVTQMFFFFLQSIDRLEFLIGQQSSSVLFEHKYKQGACPGVQPICIGILIRYL